MHKLISVFEFRVNWGGSDGLIPHHLLLLLHELIIILGWIFQKSLKFAIVDSFFIFQQIDQRFNLLFGQSIDFTYRVNKSYLTYITSFAQIVPWHHSFEVFARFYFVLFQNILYRLQLLEGVPVMLLRGLSNHGMVFHLGPFSVKTGWFHPKVPLGASDILGNSCLPVHIWINAVHLERSVICALLIRIRNGEWKTTECTNFSYLVSNCPFKYVVIRVLV